MSDNRYFSYNCPPIMQDGRFITNHTRQRFIDQYVRSMNNINTAQEFKDFLQNNGNNILDRERNYNYNNNICKIDGKCVPVSNYDPNMPQPLQPSACAPKE